MKATGYISMINQRDELLVRPTFPIAVGLAEIDVDEGFMFDGAHFD